MSWVVEEDACSVINDIIDAMGYDHRSEHMTGTAERWLEALKEFADFRREELDKLFVDFEEKFNGMVVVGPVQFSSLCPHHLFPYQGQAHVGYIPDGRVIGISKLARLVELLTHRIVTQEQATEEIADALEKRQYVHGVAVVLRAAHTCMCARGARALGSLTTTSVVRGRFLQNEHGARDEFYRIAGI